MARGDVGRRSREEKSVNRIDQPFCLQWRLKHGNEQGHAARAFAHGAVGMIAAHMTARGVRDPRAARRELLDGVDEFVDVRGAHRPALLPPTWRPVRVPPAPTARPR